MAAKCFVIMPYGKKKDHDGRFVDFDDVYAELIQRALRDFQGLEVLRCDDIEAPGWIHQRMIEQILSADVAVVDISTHNPNVFYELGVRHAVRRGVTVLLHIKGTKRPFNIQGFALIEYGTSKPALVAGRKKLRTFVAAARADPQHIDSLVHVAVPGLTVSRGPARVPRHISKFQVFEHGLAGMPQRSISIVTGDYEDIRLADVWVNSENTDMQMDKFYGKSTSATIRYLGAEKHPTTRRVKSDTIADELREKLAGAPNVDPATVIPTRAGALEASNGVRWIFHVAAVVGQLREGYRPIDSIERCVGAALREADQPKFETEKLTSMFMPIFGTGPAGGDVRAHAERCLRAAIEYFQAWPNACIQRLFFYAWSDVVLETCQSVVSAIPEFLPRQPAASSK